MIFNFANVLFLFGILQCLITIILIIKNKDWRSSQNVFLLAVLFVLFASLLPPFLGNSHVVMKYDFLRFLPLHLVLFIFPLLYLYVKSVFSKTLPTKIEISFQLLLPLIFWSYFFLIWIGTLFLSVDLKGVWAEGLGYFLVQIVHDILLLIFGIGYVYFCLKEIRIATERGLNKRQLKFTNWIKVLLILLSIGIFLEITSIILGKIYGYWSGSPLDEWLGVSFTIIVKIYNAIVLYGISFVAYNSYSSFKFKSGLQNSETKDGIISKIFAKMERDKLYLDKDLTLREFASQLGTNQARVSDLLNNELGTTFNDFVNKYRVLEVQHVLKSRTASHLTLQAISENAGFKSKTTFYRAFKKITLQTPNKYLQGLELKK